ncbi:hypothetical protein ABIA96_002984 [Bradyrhizobium sp. LB11.1]|jgi:hypothetical protein
MCRDVTKPEQSGPFEKQGPEMAGNIRENTRFQIDHTK